MCCRMARRTIVPAQPSLLADATSPYLRRPLRRLEDIQGRRSAGDKPKPQSEPADPQSPKPAPGAEPGGRPGV